MQDHDINILTLKIRRLSYLLQQSSNYEEMKSYAKIEGIYDIIMIDIIKEVLSIEGTLTSTYIIYFNDRIIDECIHEYTHRKRIDGLNQLLW